MKYDVDYDYEFEVDELGFPFLPDGLIERGNLYILPNGKYLPSGAYTTKDGGSLIYEPMELSPYAEMLAQFRE